MNEKQFINVLKVWDEDFLNARDPKEALTSFLKRMLRANKRGETDIKKISDITSSKTEELYARRVEFINTRTGTKFIIYIDYNKNKVFLNY